MHIYVYNIYVSIVYIVLLTNIVLFNVCREREKALQEESDARVS